MGLGTWDLHLGGCQSLKDKRSVLKSLKDRVRRQFNVSIAETDHHDLWQRAEVACAVVATDRANADRTLAAVDGFIEQHGDVRTIREALSEAIRLQVKDPRVGFVTITAVEASADLSHATVRVSVLGAEEDKVEAIAGLQHARGFLRTYLARTLSIRTTPELHFVLDRGLEHSRRIDAILTDLDIEEDPS